MALVNAFSSLSLGSPAATGLGFKKAVAAFAMPARVTSARPAVFQIEAKQNKKARTILVRSRRRDTLARARPLPLCGPCGCAGGVTIVRLSCSQSNSRGATRIGGVASTAAAPFPSVPARSQHIHPVGEAEEKTKTLLRGVYPFDS